MHFYNVETVSPSTTGIGLPRVTEFDMLLGIASDYGSYENVGQFSGQVNWGSSSSLINARAIWTGHNRLTTPPAASATSQDVLDGALLEMAVGDVNYGIQVNYLDRTIEHIGLIGLSGADALSGSEVLISTLCLKNFRNKTADQFSQSYQEWRSFNTQIPNTAAYPKSLVSNSWSVFNNGYPTDVVTMGAASAIFENDMVTELNVVAQNYEEASKKDAHLDCKIVLDWANNLIYTSGTLKSHRGTVFIIGNVISMGTATNDYEAYFMDESGSSSTGRPRFILNVNSSLRTVNIAFLAGIDGFESTNTSKWAFTTLAQSAEVDEIPTLPDRLTEPGAHYQIDIVNISGKIDNTGANPTYGRLDGTRSIQGYNSTESVELTESTMFPITVPPEAQRTVIQVKTKQYNMYDGNYNIILDWLNLTMEIVYECLLIRDDGFNIIGKESGNVGAYLTFGLNSNFYKYDELGETYPGGNQGNPELPTTILDQVQRIGALDVQLNGLTGVKTITTIPIVEVVSVNPSYFDVTVKNYKSLNGA